MCGYGHFACYVNDTLSCINEELICDGHPDCDHTVGGTHDELDCTLVAVRCLGTSDDTCCTVERPCEEGEGDCDFDEDCAGDLICPQNDNCRYIWGMATIATDLDCCAPPSGATNHTLIRNVSLSEGFIDHTGFETLVDGYDPVPYLFVKQNVSRIRLCEIFKIDDPLDSLEMSFELWLLLEHLPAHTTHMKIFELQDTTEWFSIGIEQFEGRYLWVFDAAESVIGEPIRSKNEVVFNEMTQIVVTLDIDPLQKLVFLYVNGLPEAEGTLVGFPDMTKCLVLGNTPSELLVQYIILLPFDMSKKQVEEHVDAYFDDFCPTEEFRCTLNGTMTCAPDVMECDGHVDCEDDYKGSNDETECQLEDVRCMGTSKDTCCTPLKPCLEGQGDCDEDTDCAEGLICPQTNNCRYIWGLDSIHDDLDCCTYPQNFTNQVEIEPERFVQVAQEYGPYLFVKQNVNQMKICELISVDEDFQEKELTFVMWIVFNERPVIGTQLTFFETEHQNLWIKVGVQYFDDLDDYFWFFDASETVMLHVMRSIDPVEFGVITQVAFAVDIDATSSVATLYVNGDQVASSDISTFPDFRCFVIGKKKIDFVVQYTLLYQYDLSEVSILDLYNTFIDSTCFNDDFPCPVDGVMTCIPSKYLCDGNHDCDDGYTGPYDEYDCSGCECSNTSCTEVAETRGVGAFKTDFGCGAVEDPSACPPVYSHFDAVQHCEAQGFRLCTITEMVSNIAASTGCGSDFRPIWSSTYGGGCEPGHYWTAPGKIFNTHAVPVRCTPALKTRTFVRCCADYQSPDCCHDSANVMLDDAVIYQRLLIEDHAIMLIPEVHQVFEYDFDVLYNPNGSWALELWALCVGEEVPEKMTLSLISSLDNATLSGYGISLVYHEESNNYTWMCTAGSGEYFDVESEPFGSENLICTHVVCSYVDDCLKIDTNLTRKEISVPAFQPNTKMPFRVGQQTPSLNVTVFHDIEFVAFYRNISQDRLEEHFELYDDFYKYIYPVTTTPQEEPNGPNEDSQIFWLFLVSVTALWFGIAMSLGLVSWWKFPEAKSVEIIWVSVASYDLVTDILYAIEQFVSGNDTFGYVSVASICLSIFVNSFLLRALFKTISESHKKLSWYENNVGGVTIVLIFSATNVESLKILYSKVFHYPLFCADFSPALKLKIGWFGVASHFLEDIPHIILQSISIMNQPGTASENLIVELALVSSIFALLIGLLKRCGVRFVRASRKKKIASVDITREMSVTRTLSDQRDERKFRYTV